MIKPLRTVHRRVFIALALLLPAIIVAGLSARHRPLPSPATMQLPPSMDLLRSSSRMWRAHAIQTEFYRNSKAPENLSVVLKPARELSDPDLLLYWSTSEPSGTTLPAGAQLLGAFRPGKKLALPAEAAQGGHLTLYSLAHQSVVDTASVEKML